MGVITFSREPCSGGTQVAEAVAAELGYHVAGKKTIEEVLIQYGFVGLKDAYDSKPNFWTRFDDETRQVVAMFDRVVLAMAKVGDVVIMGRGAFKVLERYHDVLHVRIKCPFNVRVDTYMRRYRETDRAAAETALREADKLRASYLETHYGVKKDSCAGFDLMIDTGKISPSAAVPLVIGANRSVKGMAVRGDAGTTASIEADRILLEAVRRVLAER
jgi:cytidylate kinase